MSAVFDFLLSTGTPAGEALVQIGAKLKDVHLIQGLQAGQPLIIDPDSRVAGAVSQEVTEAAGVVTVTRVA